MSISTIQQLLAEAWKKRGHGEFQESLMLVHEARDLCRENDFEMLGRVHHIYMQIDRDQGKQARAIEWCQKSLENYKKSGKANKIAHSMRHLADLQAECGEFDTARNLYIQSLDIYRKGSEVNRGNLANALRGYAILLEKLDSIKESKAAWIEAREIYHSFGIQAGVDEADDHLQRLQT